MARDPFTRRYEPDQQVHDYGGGGGGWGTSPNQLFFYLVVKSGQQDAALDPEDIQKFFRSGVNANEGYSFTLVDIATDCRLRDDVLKMENGPAFYERLDGTVPAFLITYAPMPKILSADVIKLYPVRDYDKDINVIYEHMGLQPLGVRRAFINFLRKVNSYAHLKPNILGLGANFNQMIEDLINRLERNSP